MTPAGEQAIRWDGIEGQDRPTGILSGLFFSDRIPHALIFSGPPGVGKRTAAKRFAQALVCRGMGARPCFECEPCRRVARDMFPDVISIEIPEEKKNIPIDMIREVEEIIAFRPFSGNVRVIIIDPADMMSTSSRAAILKTLEEPPSGTHFILITSRFFALPATIASRCQRVRFNPLPVDIVAGIVGESPESPVVALSRGSVSRAQSLKQGGLIAVRGELIEGLARMEHDDPGEIDLLVEKLSNFKVEFFDILDILLNWYRDLIVYHETEAVGELTDSGLWHEHKGAWSETTTASLMQCIDEIREAQRARLVNNADVRITLSFLLMTLTELKYNR
ncbi:MAG: AAA family ATPase [Deltaproteobacteria bacterium]|nr:AAA family ATPase [Candidatus Zymogenaceae bacterium]